jgi:Lhr-like helicase
MAESKLLELPYEKTAMVGGEIPDGLEYPDQILFLELRLLYESYRKGLIDRNVATREKVELLRTYEAQKIVDKMGKEWVDQIKCTELARAEYRKDKTIENADKLLACVEGGKYYG